MLYKVILLFFINILFLKSLVALESKARDYLNQDYDLFKVLYNNNYTYFYKNKNILNLSPNLNINGLTNINFNINGATSNFLNLPLNNISIISPAFFVIGSNKKKTFLSTHSLSDIDLVFHDTTSLTPTNANKLGIRFSNNIFSNVLAIDGNFMGYYKNEEYSLLLAINYMHVNNSSKIDNFINNVPITRYNNLVSFQYTPKDKNVSLKITNLSFCYDAKRDITTNENAKFYFGSNFLKQAAFGNFFIASYETLFNKDSLYNYYSHIAISNNWLNVDNEKNLFKDKSIYYENIDYKVQNVSNINDMLYNNVLLTYGIKLDRNVTIANARDKKFYWPTGIENNYKIFLDSDINILNANVLYIKPGINLKRSIYKANEHNSYRLNNVEPHLNIVLNLTKNISLYGTYLYSERLPYIYEKYINGNYFYNDYFIKFNPNYVLKKQENNHWEGGINAKFSFYNNINLEANFNAFYYKNKNHIDYKFIDKSNVVFTNLNYAILSGYKASIHIKAYNLYTNIIYNIVKGGDNNGNYLNSLYPDNVIIDSSFDVPIINLNIGMKAKLFDKFSKYSNNYPFERNKLPGYSLFDIYFDYKCFKDRLSLIIGVENIFNKKYQVPYILEAYKDRRYFCNFTLQL